MCSLRILASVKVSHLMRRLFFCLPNTVEWSTKEHASTRPSTRESKVNGHPRERCTSAVRWSTTAQRSQINDLCLRDKEIQFGEPGGEEKGGTVTLNALFFASLLLPILLCCFHFALSSFLLCVCPPPSTMLCLEKQKKKTTLEVNTFSYNFITGLHCITVSILSFCFFFFCLFESRLLMPHA